MIVRNVHEEDTGRLVRAADEVGFGMEEVRFLPGESAELTADRAESLFITEGRGEVVDPGTGERAELRRGVVCVLRPGDVVHVLPVEEIVAVRAMTPAADG